MKNVKQASQLELLCNKKKGCEYFRGVLKFQHLQSSWPNKHESFRGKLHLNITIVFSLLNRENYGSLKY